MFAVLVMERLAIKNTYELDVEAKIYMVEGPFEMCFHLTNATDRDGKRSLTTDDLNAKWKDFDGWAIFIFLILISFSLSVFGHLVCMRNVDRKATQQQQEKTSKTTSEK